MGMKNIFNFNKEKNPAEDISQAEQNLKEGEFPVTEIVEDKKEREPMTPEEAQEIAPLYSDVILALKQVYDPEIPVNIYDLGLIYELYIDKNHDVEIQMTFTAPTCPMADEVLQEVKKNVEDVPNINSCRIDLVFDPVWDQSMLSDEARIDLGLD